MGVRLRSLKTIMSLGGLMGLTFLSGCYTPIQDLKPTTFGQEQLNVASEGRLVTILSIMPARATVANTNSIEATGTGWWIGNFVEPPELHPQALILAYQDPNNPKIQNTIEIAKVCEFKPGTAYAVLIDGQTKIQPNNFQACLDLAKKSKKQRKQQAMAQQAPAQNAAPQQNLTQSAPQAATSASGTVQNTPNAASWPQSPVQQAMEQQSKQNWPRPKTWSN